MGSDAAEFVDKVKDQVRSRQKRMSNVADSGEEHSIIGNVHGCDDECGDIHGKEFLNYSKFHHEFQRSHFEENWWANKKRSIIWTKFIGERILGDNCH